MRHLLLRGRGLLALVLALALATPALAAERRVTLDGPYTFSPADFQEEPGDGVLLTALPERTLGTLYLGNRALRSGDAVAWDALEQLTFSPTGEVGEGVITCLCQTGDTTQRVQLTLRLGGEKNQPPTAEDSSFETYKNIPGQVPLTVQDPENEDLTVTIVDQPKRGDVTVSADGTVTYTPKKNKVGQDRFTYTVTDPAGLSSEEATVRIQILRPSDRQTYGDLEDDPALLAATWLREEGIFSGETVAGQLLFLPDAPMTRGEFLAMCVGLVGAEPDGTCISTGFADESVTPSWLSPYVTTALRCGYLSGMPTDGGLSLQGQEPVTQLQAVKLVGSMLEIEEETATVMSGEIPAWAANAVSAMDHAAVFSVTDPDAVLTRRDAALLLFRAKNYQQNRGTQASLLAWAARS